MTRIISIVNTGATIDHDCQIADGVHIGPGSHLCGHVGIGSATLIGAGTTLQSRVFCSWQRLALR
jgi:UDP-3-O-[3-hydroxymyristoyl] glucosamine N-acyltransferase